MTREEIIRNLKYTLKKHKNDTVHTFDTNISVMCKDILDYLEQEPKWIPCSERLPEEYGEYLITWTTSQSKKPFIAICECEISNLYNFEKNRFDAVWLLEDYIKAYPDVEIIAWMPLPDPYRG